MLDRHTLARLCRAKDLLRDPDAPAISVPELARDSGLSPYHFIRRFAAVFGETPHQLRIAARLDRAKLLLVCGERSVTDVCLEVGFASLGSFSDAFARRVGVPPSEYRRRIRTLIPAPAGMLASRYSRVAVPPDLHPGCFSLMCALPNWPR